MSTVFTSDILDGIKQNNQVNSLSSRNVHPTGKIRCTELKKLNKMSMVREQTVKKSPGLFLGYVWRDSWIGKVVRSENFYVAFQYDESNQLALLSPLAVWRILLRPSQLDLLPFPHGDYSLTNSQIQTEI